MKRFRNCARDRDQPEFPAVALLLAAALAALGRLDEARAAAMEGLAMDPTFTVRRYRGDAQATIRCFSPGASASTK